MTRLEHALENRRITKLMWLAGRDEARLIFKELRQNTIVEEERFKLAIESAVKSEVRRMKEQYQEAHEFVRSARAELTPLENFRHFLQAWFPVLYSKVLEPTIADLYLEHSAALAEGHPLKARCVLLQGCYALTAAAVCQLGFSLLRRITALWQARSSK